MKKFNLYKRFEPSQVFSQKCRQAMRMFGLDTIKMKESEREHKCEVAVGEGDIVFFTGPSGSGKSVLMRELKASLADEDVFDLDDVELSRQQSVLDSFEGDCISNLRFLSYAGLSDVFCVLKKPVHLSEGQKWRFRLAAALASGARYVFADEFCSNLDRVTAAVIAYKVRKFAIEHGVTFVLAASNDDIVGDLRPEVIVRKELAGKAKVVYQRENVRT